jgi:hypothetical protein
LRHIVKSHPLFFALLTAVPIVEIIAGVRGGPGPSLAVVRNPFAAIALASVFCRYIIHDRTGRTRKWIVYLTPLAWGVVMAVEGRNAPVPLMWLDMLFALGMLGTVGFLVAAAAAPDAVAKSRYIDQLLNALLFPLGASMVSFGLWSTHQVNPVYDGRVYAFEEILGLQFSILGVQSYHLLRPLSAVASGCYATLALAMTVVAGAQGSATRERQFLTATVVAGACGFALYFLCPIVGPLTAFGPLYPQALPALGPDAPLLIAPTGAPRNGMPSLHTIWALLIWFNVGALSAPLRAGLKIFVVLTLWAVMGLDDTHWLTDVVVAVPLAVALQAAFVPASNVAPARRWTNVAACACVPLIWLVALRAGTPLLDFPPVLAWLAVLATVCWPLSRVLWTARVSASDRIGTETASGSPVNPDPSTPPTADRARPHTPIAAG